MYVFIEEGCISVHFLSSLLSARSIWPVNVSGTWSVAGSTPSDPQEVSGHGDGWLEDQGRLPLCVWADEIHKTRSDGMANSYTFSLACMNCGEM